MVETLTPSPAFAGHLEAGHFGANAGTPGIVASCVDYAGMALVIARKGQNAALALKWRLEPGPKRHIAGARAFVGLGPGQWLVTGEAGLASHLAGELADLASVTDQTDSRAVLRLSGNKVREVLAKGVPLDLHPASFSSGDAAATLVSLVSVWLWQLDDAPTYELAVPRSMAGSFAAWLVASSGEFGMVMQ